MGFSGKRLMAWAGAVAVAVAWVWTDDKRLLLYCGRLVRKRWSGWGMNDNWRELRGFVWRLQRKRRIPAPERSPARCPTVILCVEHTFRVQRLVPMQQCLKQMLQERYANMTPRIDVSQALSDCP